MLAATYAKRPGHWCAGSPSQLHHEAQQRHKGVGLSACEQLCSRLACPCYQYRTADRECRVSPPGEFERPKKSGQGFDAFVRASPQPNASASTAAALSLAMAEFVKREREAWRLLPGCAATPDDPYSDAHLEQLFGGIPRRPEPRQWEEVLRAWRAACMTGHMVLVSLYKGRVGVTLTRKSVSQSVSHDHTPINGTHGPLHALVVMRDAICNVTCNIMRNMCNMCNAMCSVRITRDRWPPQCATTQRRAAPRLAHSYTTESSSTY